MTLPLDITPFFSGSTLAYSANGLPAGLILNSSTGLISGNPTTPGVSAVTVTATNAAGSAQQSFQWTITSAASLPSQVSGLIANGGDAQVTLSWEEPNNNGSVISDYVIERRIAGGVFVVLNDGAGIDLSFVDTGLGNDVFHEYRVSAVNAIGTGAASAIAGATPTSSVTVPDQVTGVLATPGDAQVTLSWLAPSDGGSPLTDYLIEVDSGSGFSVLSDGTGVSTSFVHTGLVNGTQYTYRVAATNSIGVGAASAPASATPNAIGSGATIVTRDTGVDGSSGNTYNFAGVNIGTGDVLISTTHRGGVRATGVTLAGNAMTLLGSDTDGVQGMSFWRLDAQSAGSVDVVVSLQNGASRCGIGVWTLDGAGTSTASFDVDAEPVSGAEQVTTDIAASNNGLLLAHASCVGGGSPPALAFTNVDAVDLGGGVFVEELGPSENVFHALADRGTSAAQNETVTMDAPVSSNLQMLAVASISPA
ncbi:MAG: fibronectin type III domain-containing protein [Pseudomonadota bacterium]